MQNTIATPTGNTVIATPLGHQCPVSWGAILCGAAAAASISLVLLAVGSGVGIASFNPWSGDRESIASFTMKAAAWMVCMQWLSAALGGYISGRLRGSNVQTGRDEVFFRDTAHGFMAWAVATLFTATLLASAAGALVGGGTKAATAVASAGAAGGAVAMQGADPDRGARVAGFDMIGYDVDALLRSPQPTASINNEGAHREITGIFRNSMTATEFPSSDREYVASLVAAQAGISQEEALTRVDATVAKMNALKAEAKETAEKARKASAAFAIFTALSLMVGAFIAAVAAALGGLHRDDPVSYDPIRN